MINKITDAFKRPYDKSSRGSLPSPFGQALDATRAALSPEELRVLVAAMVD
ncbi:hypothetical protein EDF56_105294 [Novosphingobium sp. PhB165]|uniref:hypothetical protein n=1 Tax=Novosphingobium sp. PhB165 TaxID=2485105 RepID=UPI0010E1D853|nr:hypothetical protein [Novosphingobium sp. PhB165]TCM17946.1 hypothetical protein EDF56_105294 [Novosphingobium sp. PhB165]